MISFAFCIAPLPGTAPKVSPPINRQPPGRKPKLTEQQVREVQRLVAEKVDTKSLSEAFGISRQRINYYGRRKS